MRFKWFVLILLIGLLVIPTVAAREVLQGNDCVIGPNQTVEGDLFVLCRTFKLNGTVHGNVFGAAFAVDIDGTADGNLYILAAQMDVRGHVSRDLVFGGPVLRVHPSAVIEDVRGDLLSASLSTEVASGARIPGSITSLSYQLLIDGDVGREVSFWGSALTINGQIDGDVNAAVGDANLSNASQLQTLLVPFRLDVNLIAPGLTVSEDAAIAGQLTYSSTSPGVIDASLNREPVFEQIVNAPDFTQINDLTEESNVTWLTGYLAVVIREFVTLGVIGLIAIRFLPRPLQAPMPHLRHRPLNSLGAGILTFILSIGLWVVVLLLTILVILALLALRLSDLIIVMLMLLGVINVGGASAFYFIAIYISRILVALTVGRFVVRFALGDDGTSRMLYLNLLVGAGLMAVLVFLPVVGGVINALALALGLGAIVLTAPQIRGIPTRRTIPVSLPSAPEDARQIPPPIVTEKPHGPGMDNLPEGFQWWKDS